MKVIIVSTRYFEIVYYLQLFRLRLSQKFLML